MGTPTETWIAEANQHLFANYRRQPLVLVRGEGSRVWDLEGREYLDFVQGLAVNALGHASPVIAEAVAVQARKLVHTSNLFYTEPQAELARLLTAHGGLERVFFCNSGAEAIETALKLARRFHYAKGDKERIEILSFEASFHGRTLGALAATGQPKYHEGFEPLVPGIRTLPFGDLRAVERAMGPKTAAVIIEPIQAEGGIRVPPPGFLAGLRALCNHHGALLIFDEVQVGMGRTGTLFGYQHDGVKPDIMALAKALGGGIPIGATCARADVAAALVPGTHASTFGGNPLACAAGVAAFKAINTPAMLENVRARGAQIEAGFAALKDKGPVVVERRGRGLLQGFAIKGDAAAIVTKCREKGLLVCVAGPDVVRVVPAFNVTESDVSRMLEIVASAV